MNTNYISRSVAIKALIALTFPLILTSCGTDSNAQVATLIQKEVSGWSSVTNVETPQVTLVQELTGSDSLLLMNEQILQVNESYNHQLNQLTSGVKLLARSRDHLYYSNGTVNPYYRKECDNLITDMKEACKKVNKYSEGLAGKYDPMDMSSPVFKSFSDLSSKKNVVVAKVYKAILNYHVTRHSGGFTMEVKTEVRYFFISPDGTKVMKSSDQFSIPQGSQEQFLDFKRYSVSNEGKITTLSAETKLENDPSTSEAGETTILAKYIRSEFMEYCNVNFLTKNSEDIFFINPELGEYQDEMCGMKESFIGAWFEITYSWGEMKVHTEEGNEIMETYIIKKIRQVKN